MADRDPDRSVSQTVRAQLALRGLILSGRLRPGERISELQAVESIGVSRTPVRMALVRLEEEGLLEGHSLGRLHGEGVFRARHPGLDRDPRHAGRLGGAFAAERGVSVRDLTPLKENLAELDVLMRREPLSVEVFLAHVSLNARFHALLSDLSGSAPLVRQIERVSALPFASPSGFVMAQSALAETRQILQIAQDHHHVVIDAIENREGARAEAVCTSMRGSQRATYGLRCATVPISSCCRRWRWCVRRLRAFRSENCSSWRGVRPRPERAMRDGLILRDTATVRSSG